MQQDEQNVETTNEEQLNAAPEAGVENLSEPAVAEAPAIAEEAQVAGDEPTETIGEAPTSELNRDGQEL